jgi:PAS domain S-box-containing protein
LVVNDARQTRQIERLSTVYQLTSAVSRAQGLADIYAAALASLERALSTDRASILLFDADGVMRFKAWRGLSDRYRAAVEGHTPWDRNTPEPDPLVVPDVQADAAWSGYRHVFDAEGIRALGFIPLVSRGSLIGKFMVYFAEPHAFDEEEIRLAQTIAGHVAFAVDRRRYEEKLVLYREIFAHSTDAIAIVDTAGVYVEQNAAHRALVGYSDEELAGRTPAIHLGEERFQEVARALQSDGTFHQDVASTMRSGRELAVDLSAFAVRDESGSPVCYVGIKRDVTERKRIEASLQFLASASAALDRSLDFDETVRIVAGLSVPFLCDWALVETLDASGAPGAVVAAHADPDRSRALGRLAELRGRGRAALGWDSKGSTVERVASVGDLFPASGAEATLLLSEVGGRSAIVAPLRARGRLLGALTLVSARGDYGAGEMALAEDLGRRAATALDNARLYREAQESDRRKEEFLAVLAHELRNPLMPLITCLELMRLGVGDAADAERRREIMDRQVRNLKRLVDDLLDVSRITRGKFDLQKETVSLSTIVSRAIETTRPVLEAQGLHLAVRLEPGVEITADPLRLEQALANLLSNAAKYTSAGGHVELSGGQEDGCVVVRVADDGTGIPSDMLPRVFDLFVQGSRSAGGLGVGLTLVRAVAEMHGGSVEAASEGPGHGSRFTLRLPIAAPPGTDAQATPDRRSAANGGVTEPV